MKYRKWIILGLIAGSITMGGLYLRHYRMTKEVERIVSDWHLGIQVQDYELKDYVQTAPDWYGERLTVVILRKKQDASKKIEKEVELPLSFSTEMMLVQKEFNLYKIRKKDLKGVVFWEKKVYEKYTPSTDQYSDDQYNDDLYVVMTNDHQKKTIYLMENQNVLDVERDNVFPKKKISPDKNGLVKEKSVAYEDDYRVKINR